MDLFINYSYYETIFSLEGRSLPKNSIHGNESPSNLKTVSRDAALGHILLG
jgi:hypothetical protein